MTVINHSPSYLELARAITRTGQFRHFQFTAEADMRPNLAGYRHAGFLHLAR
jgi:hypothetical protein